MSKDLPKEWTISINDSGQIYWQNTEVKLDDLVPKLQAIVKNDERIYIRKDKKIDFVTVAKVMKRIGSAGYQRISVLYETD